MEYLFKQQENKLWAPGGKKKCGHWNPLDCEEKLIAHNTEKSGQSTWK